MSLFQLTEKTWLIQKKEAVSCSEEEFSEFWKLCPTVRHKIKIMGKFVDIPRFQKLYGEGVYIYSGTETVGDPNFPEIVKRCLEISKEMYPEFSWNGALVNWYPDGKSYIGAHSDDEKDLVENAPILSFSFGGVRTFRLKYKKNKKNNSNKSENKKIIEKIDFLTENKSLIVMGGNCQKEYKHEIPKTSKKVSPRINVTVRSFKL
jgi:alkylated DNA repair dioxygenase AlkB